MGDTNILVGHSVVGGGDGDVVGDVSVEPVAGSNGREWHSCCMTIDRDFFTYVTQILLILLVIVFCIYQLLTLKECVYQITYTSLLTLLIGLVIPNPTIKK